MLGYTWQRSAWCKDHIFVLQRDLGALQSGHNREGQAG